MEKNLEYAYGRKALWIVLLGGVLASYALVWMSRAEKPVNFIDGDPEFYYYYLQAAFGDVSHLDYEWLKPGSINTITHHPAGIALLLAPFYLLAYIFASALNYATDGTSLPFQLAISAAALFYTVLGLWALLRFLRLQNIPNKIGAIIVLLLFFGSTLFQYSIVEPAMSHLYSFCFISVFLYTISKFLESQNNRFLLQSSLALGFVLLIRPNNIFILLFLPFLFSKPQDFFSFLKDLLKRKSFYVSVLILFVFAALQLLTWAVFEKQLYSDRYAAYGFNWLQPHFLETLFGFEAGFFIYCPLCFLFLFGLLPILKENKFRFYVAAGFIALLFYFFSAYSAYTYFDGLGIRVLVDFYPVFALLGAKLFSVFEGQKFLLYSMSSFALIFVVLNLVYTYQSSTGILLRAGMTFDKWKYIFLQTGSSYRGVLGGMNDYPPYSKKKPGVLLSENLDLKAPFDYSQKEYGAVLHFDSLGFSSNRIFLEVDCTREESAPNSSSEALVCVALNNQSGETLKSYFQFKLNETPSEHCCEKRVYRYSSNMSADFLPGDHLSVYIWNHKLQNFKVHQFTVRIYNYNYQTIRL